MLEREFPGQVFVLAVFAKQRLRYARLGKRPEYALDPGRKPPSATGQRSRKPGESAHIALADVTIVNDGTARSYWRQPIGSLIRWIAAGEDPGVGLKHESLELHPSTVPHFHKEDRVAERKRAYWQYLLHGYARVVATRSTCPRKHVGAVIVRDRTKSSTGL